MIYKTISTPHSVKYLYHNRKQYEKTTKRKKRKRKTIFINFDRSVLLRTFQAIRLLCETNINQHQVPGESSFAKTLFITFTFKENITDITFANREFGKFNRCLKNFTKQKIKYLAVPEFQKRGAVHYHVLYFNLPYIPMIYDFFNKLWGKGWVIFRKVNDFRPAKYLVKDITKKIDFPFGKKRYFTSRGLFKPDIQTSDKPIPLGSGLSLQKVSKYQGIDYEVNTEFYAVDN